ncbi:TonB-dependent receptor [Aurantiacibacter rhizosphaerae]|uniref:TonB-dependent receptor n=1 Tax=Aurantiacibacter rhizosphaerae TaxID=2691582 RepID=A0A844XCS5_9SPHN|nr:TonB-dependent receptor [Aurantiacibacter rhizosphaerae]MWV27418.1 TonB-dependent receptor [Aurantiacibacter rhizosphaerae]
MMNEVSVLQNGLKALAAAALCSTSSIALAQDAQSPAAEEQAASNEIVVTAQRRAEPLQKVPISITAYDSEGLARSQITDTRALAVATPGLQVAGSFQFSKPVFAIRGISFKSFNATDQQAVGVYQDEVYIAARSGQLSQMYDLESVEVLRGPQGILYGKNTTGGAINLNSKQPGYDLEGQVTARVGNLSLKGVEAGVTLPLNDQAAVRLAGTFERRHGAEFNEFVGERTYGYRNYAGRAILRYDVSEAVTVTANVHAANTRANPNYYYSRGLIPTGNGKLGDINGYVASDDFFTIASDLVDERERIRQNGAILRIEVELDAVDIVSVSAFDRTKYSLWEDTDASGADIATVDYNDLSRQFSQELRMASTDGGPLSWLAGLYVFDEKLKAANITTFFGGTSDQNYTQNTTDYAAFGQLTYDVTDRLSLIAGARYTYEEKSIEFLTIDDGVYDFSGFPVTLVDDYTKRTFKAPTYKLGVNFQMEPTKLLYASYNRGFKTGGFNGTVFVPGEFTTVNPEYVNAYEAGFKSTWLDRAIIFNLAGFYNDFSDLQVFNFVDGIVPVTQVVNAASARTYGVETDLTLRPVRAITLALAGTWLNAKITDVEIQNLAFLEGNRLPLAPKLNLTGSAQYEFDISNTSTLTPRVEAIYNSRQYLDNNQDLLASQGRHTIVNAFLRYEQEDAGLVVSAFLKNAFETEYLNESFPFPPIGAYLTKHGEPRTYGVSVTKNF